MRTLARADDCDNCSHLRAVLVTVSERIEDGAYEEAHDACAAALDDPGASPPGLRCPKCSLAVRWPGELEHHLLVSHRLGWDDVDELVRRAA